METEQNIKKLATIEKYNHQAKHLQRQLMDSHQREDLSCYSARQQAVIRNIRQAGIRINQKMESVSAASVAQVTKTCEASLPPDHREYLRAIHEWLKTYEQVHRNPDQQADAASNDKLSELARRALSTPSSVVKAFLEKQGSTGETLRDLLAWQQQQDEALVARPFPYLHHSLEANREKQNDPSRDTSAACQTMPNHVTEPPEHQTGQ